ncbi:MAG: hypothetical protein SCH68_04925 [Brevefilum sp.]|nr:hypothetical protein [Brevefilum sp.]
MLVRHIIRDDAQPPARCEQILSEGSTTIIGPKNGIEIQIVFTEYIISCCTVRAFTTRVLGEYDYPVANLYLTRVR